jgi:uncharacterized damage-inducible protein DinB
MAHEQMSTEKQLLLETLNGTREHVLGILDDLSPEDLRRPVLPSGWTCLGLVNHLALDVERFWFSHVIAGVPEPGGESADDGWQVDPGVPAADVLDSYRREIERANAVISSADLDEAPGWWPEGLFGSWRLASVRETMLHVITETACHAGHLDAARELIDGRQWIVLTG